MCATALPRLLSTGCIVVPLNGSLVVPSSKILLKTW
jgi:hypothetical protein